MWDQILIPLRALVHKAGILGHIFLLCS